LIVIMLIGILSGVILGVINIGGIRAKTRDAQRAGDLKKFQTALELYFADNRSYVPSSWGTAGGTLLGLQTSRHINKIPVDPAQAGTATDPCTAATNYDYWYVGNEGSYILATNMEVATSDDSNTCAGLNSWATLAPGCTPAGNCYGVENPF
jgi:type II secretory pathway pseudopilin PulG